MAQFFGGSAPQPAVIRRTDSRSGLLPQKAHVEQAIGESGAGERSAVSVYPGDGVSEKRVYCTDSRRQLVSQPTAMRRAAIFLHSVVDFAARGDQEIFGVPVEMAEDNLRRDSDY
jgi:hypothetical protein